MDEKSETLKRELYRSSLDSIRVYNPTDQDFYVIWDGQKHLVPSKNKSYLNQPKGHRVLLRYLANWYRKHMTDYIINKEQDVKLMELKTKYQEAGVEDSLLKANLDVERNRGLRTDNEEEVRRIASIIWLGIEEKFGLDDEIQETSQEIESSNVNDRISKELENKVYKKEVTEEKQEQAVTYPINAKKKLVEEVSK